MSCMTLIWVLGKPRSSLLESILSHIGVLWYLIRPRPLVFLRVALSFLALARCFGSVLFIVTLGETINRMTQVKVGWGSSRLIVALLFVLKAVVEKCRISMSCKKRWNYCSLMRLVAVTQAQNNN